MYLKFMGRKDGRVCFVVGCGCVVLAVMGGSGWRMTRVT
jgi:hypothetical protein